MQGLVQITERCLLLGQQIPCQGTWIDEASSGLDFSPHYPLGQVPLHRLRPVQLRRATLLSSFPLTPHSFRPRAAM